MATPVESGHHLAQNLQKMLTVSIVLIDRLTTITTRRHMIERTTEFKAKGSGHARGSTPVDATMLDLTPSVFLGTTQLFFSKYEFILSISI